MRLQAGGMGQDTGFTLPRSTIRFINDKTPKPQRIKEIQKGNKPAPGFFKLPRGSRYACQIPKEPMRIRKQMPSTCPVMIPFAFL